MTPTMQRLLPLLALISSSASYCSGFSPNAMRCKSSLVQPNPIRTSSTTTTQLHGSYAINSESEAMILLSKADKCAHSDTCSLDDAYNYLNEIVNIQSSCVTGTLKSQEVCDDAVYVSEVIVSLRQKISALSLEQGESANRFPWSSSVMSSNAIVLLTALYLASGLFHLVLFSGSESADPFTAQEVWWSIRDGYFTDLVAHYMKNGGLATNVDTGLTGINSFTPQEVWWSIRDGYLGDVVSHFTRNGGLVNHSDGVIISDSNIHTPMEWYWSIRDGYVNDLVSSAMKN